MDGERGIIEIEGDDAARAARGALSATDKAILGAAGMPRDRGLRKLQPLLASGDINAHATQAQTGATALHKACMKANPGCAAALLTAGWSLAQLDLMKRTPVHLLATQHVGLLRSCMCALHSPALPKALLARDGAGAAPLGVSLAKLQQLANSVDPTNINAKTPGVYEFAAGIMHVASCAASEARCPPSTGTEAPPSSYRPAFVSSRADEVFAIPSGLTPPAVPLGALIRLSRVASPVELLRCLLWMEDASGYTPHVLLSPPPAVSPAASPAASPVVSPATAPGASPAVSPAAPVDGNASDSFDEDAPPAAAASTPPAATAAAVESGDAPTHQGHPLPDGWTAHAVWWGQLAPGRGTAGFALPPDLAAGALEGITAAQAQQPAAVPPGEKLLDVLSSQTLLWALRRAVVLCRAKRRQPPPPAA